MLIGIDGNEANVEKRVGIGQYAFELLKQFEEFRIQNLEFRIYLKNKQRKDLPKEREGWWYRIVRPKKLWTQVGLPLDLYLHKPRPDVFFTPTHYAPRFSPVPTAISIMDLSYEFYPQLFKKSDLYQLKNWTAYSARKAKKIFTISKASKDDIIKVYNASEDKVVVTYPGIKKSSIRELSDKAQSSNMSEIKNKFGISEKYILFVGTLQPRKNVVRLIEAFARILKEAKDKNLELVLVGKRGWLYEEILEAPKKFNIEENVKILEFVNDEDLQLLYKNAICFVLPSLYEGFGLPVLEAMVNGCPVITSNVSSLPEAGGDAALYFDPKNVDDMVKKISPLLNNEKLRKEMIEKGYKQAKKFTWEKTAKETLSVLEELARKS